MKRLADELESKKIDNLYRKRVVREGQQDPIVFIDGKKAISFCGNNYLGLASHPAVIQAFIDGANKYGVGSGSSNLISGYTDAQKILEGSSYCPSSFSMVLNIRPLAKGKQYLSMKPPLPPA